MAATDIDICNLALSHLRQKRINAFTDRSPEAMECQRWYAQALDASLRSFNWPFAKGVVQTALVVGATRPGWCRAYELPANCLAVREIARPNRVRIPPIPYELGRYSGRTVLFTSATDPWWVFTERVTDVPDFDPLFVSAFAYTLAMELAMPLTGKVSLVDAMRKLAAGVVAQAENAAANEDTNDLGDDPVPDWLARRGVVSLTRRERYGFWDLCGGSAVSTVPSTPDPGISYTLLADVDGSVFVDSALTAFEVV